MNFRLLTASAAIVSSMLCSCSGDDMIQELETFIPTNVKVDPQTDTSVNSDTIIITETIIKSPRDTVSQAPDAIAFDADYVRGTYYVEVTGSCQRPGHARQAFLGASRSNKIYSQIQFTKKADRLYNVAIEGFRTVAWDFPFDIDVECRVVDAMYDDEYYYVVESSEFQIDLNAACAYRQHGNKVDAKIEAKVFRNRIQVSLYTDLSWSPKDDLEKKYVGFADMTMACDFSAKRESNVGDWTFGKLRESSWFELPSDENIDNGNQPEVPGTDPGDDPEPEPEPEAAVLTDMVGNYFDPGMKVNVQGSFLDPVQTTIETKVSGEKLSIALYNFSIEQDGDMIVVGDIKADCESVYNDDINGFDISGSTTVFISDLGLEVYPVLEGTVTKEKLELVIDIEVMEGFNVQVTFNGDKK